MSIVLASASPRRAQLLRAAGIDFTVYPSNADESKVVGVDAKQTALLRAELKAKSVFEKVGSAVLGADTVVVKDGVIFGKPADAKTALQMFNALCGGEHEVVTGICLVSKTKTVKHIEVTKVKFKPYDASIVESYVRSGKPFDKAGGYGLQDEEIQALIEKIDGDADNVIGLPMRAVVKLVKEKDF